MATLSLQRAGLALFLRYERLLRYVIVGAAMAGLYSMLAAGLILAHVPIGAMGASFCASLVTIPVSFLVHRRVTYRDTAYARFQWARFAFLGMATLALNLALMALAQTLGAPFWTALIAGWFVVPAVNYALNAVWVFRTRHFFALDR